MEVQLDKTPSKEAPNFRLDWSRLLGFDQANPRTGDSQQLGRAGAKASTKSGLTRAGAKLGGKFGAKVGAKLARKA